ncbi:hypothetical protein RKD37_005358 [Streptomyces ambofaciens]
MSGVLGSDRGPVAETTTSAVRVPRTVSISHRSCSVSHAIRFTSESKRRWGRSPKVSVTCSR